MSDSLTIGTPQSGPVQEPVRSGRSANATDKGAPSSSDRIDLETQNGLLSLAQAVSSPEREQRIQQLHALVAGGQYQVDARALSESIVSSALNGS